MPNEHAVVTGGSLSGLLAARVLSQHFSQITLVERDECPGSSEPRRGVPQGRHTHGLLASGRQVLEDLFPGLTAELTAEGALTADIVKDARWFMDGACLARPASQLLGLLVSRPRLEAAVRRRLQALPNVKHRGGATCEGWLTENRRVTGVRLRTAAGEETLPADLVVDAAGRGSKAPAWLAAMSFPEPPTEAVEVGVAYTTFTFERQPTDLDGDLCAVIPPEPDGKRGGVMLAQEGGRWIVTLIRHFGPAAPTDLEGFRDFAASLPAPYIYEAIRHARPLTEPVVARFPSSVRRRYEHLDDFPEGLLVTGDAICSFNPIYGQGMSVAALEAVELGACLREGRSKLAQRFFARAARVVEIPWAIAVGNDLRMPETVGPRSRTQRFINWYVGLVRRAAHQDPALSVAYHRVGNLLAPPASLFRPAAVGRTLRGAWRARRPAAPGALKARPAAV